MAGKERDLALGVIGGSGVYSLASLRDVERLNIDTPFGRPSAPISAGQIGPTRIYFLPRHGEGHHFSPTDLPYRANVHALKQLGVTHLLSLSAVGSLREQLPPRSIVLPEQIIDRTVDRMRTFFDRGVVAHVGIADPFCARLQEAIAVAAGDVDHGLVRGGTYVCIEGPQFSTRAESHLYRSWGASVIGMTAMPEARLAREAELCYATMALVTDYDVWHDSEEDVSVEVVMSHLEANSLAASDIMGRLALNGLPTRDCPCSEALDHAIVTSPDLIGADVQERLRVIAGDRVAPR